MIKMHLYSTKQETNLLYFGKVNLALQIINLNGNSLYLIRIIYVNGNNIYVMKIIYTEVEIIHKLINRL